MEAAARRAQLSAEWFGVIDEGVYTASVITASALGFAVLSFLGQERLRLWALSTAVLGGAGLAYCAMWIWVIIHVHIRDSR